MAPTFLDRMNLKLKIARRIPWYAERKHAPRAFRFPGWATQKNKNPGQKHGSRQAEVKYAYFMYTGSGAARME